MIVYYLFATLTLLARLRGTKGQTCCAVWADGCSFISINIGTQLLWVKKSISLYLSFTQEELLSWRLVSRYLQSRSRLSIGLLVFQLMIHPNKAFMLPRLAMLFISPHYLKCIAFWFEYQKQAVLATCLGHFAAPGLRKWLYLLVSATCQYSNSITMLEML